MLRAKLTITGLEKARQQIQGLDAKIKDLSAPLQMAGEYLMEFFSKDVYQTEGAAIGNPWAPLTEPYATQKRKRWGQTPILIASGKMSRSYSLKVASNYLIIQNDALNSEGQYYAGYHQEGTPKMVARPIMKFRQEQLKKVRDIVVNHINSIIQNMS